MQILPIRGYELFSMYGFSIEYPDSWDVELNPKSDRSAGDVVFKTTRQRIFLTWGSLELIKEKYGSLDKHVEAGLEKVRKGSDVKKMEMILHKEDSVNGHRAIFNRFRVTVGVSFYAMRTAYRELSSVHLHCEETGKFFVISESVMGQDIVTDPEVFGHIKGSFTCH